MSYYPKRSDAYILCEEIVYSHPFVNGCLNTAKAGVCVLYKTRFMLDELGKSRLQNPAYIRDVGTITPVKYQERPQEPVCHNVA